MSLGSCFWVLNRDQNDHYTKSMAGTININCIWSYFHGVMLLLCHQLYTSSMIQYGYKYVSSVNTTRANTITIKIDIQFLQYESQMPLLSCSIFLHLTFSLSNLSYLSTINTLNQVQNRSTWSLPGLCRLLLVY